MEIERIQSEVQMRDNEKKKRILHSMDEAGYRLKKLEDQKKERQKQKQDQDMIKKMERDQSIQRAVELKQKKINEV